MTPEEWLARICEQIEREHVAMTVGTDAIRSTIGPGRRFVKITFPTGTSFLLDEFADSFALSIKVPGDPTWHPIADVTFEYGYDHGFSAA